MQEDLWDHTIPGLPSGSSSQVEAERWQCCSSAGKKVLGGNKVPTHHIKKAIVLCVSVYLFEKQAVGGFLTCPKALGISSPPGANSAFLIFPSVKYGCYWGRCKDGLDRSVS